MILPVDGNVLPEGNCDLLQQHMQRTSLSYLSVWWKYVEFFNTKVQIMASLIYEDVVQS